MRRFWEDVVRPCFEATHVRRIVEIGSDRGENTVKLVNYAIEKGGFVYAIDPAPQFDYEEAFRGKENYYSFLITTSINALPKIHEYDAILIDGDHNYYTVYTELQLILKNTEKFPLVLFHDIGWPYDRRDLYYDPDTIPQAWQNTYKISGIDPDTEQLSDKGFNHKYRNSVSYNKDHCGVLTAVEDFIKENDSRFTLIKIPIMSGLGIMLDIKQNYSEEFIALIHALTPSDSLMNLMRYSDKWFAKTHSRLEQYIEANQRLKNQVIERDQEINTLQAKLAEEKSKYLEQVALEQKKREQINTFYEKALNERDNLSMQLADKEKKIQRLSSERASLENYYLNSIRFRIGTAFVDASHSPKELLRLPKTLFSLYRAGKEQDEKGKIAKINGVSSKGRTASVVALEKKQIETSRFSKNELKELHVARIKPYSAADKPLVSIIILNRNGLHHLETLFASMKQAKFYDNYEMIIVDNGSTDGSQDYIKSQSLGKTIRLIENQTNESFSYANNQAAKNAAGSYLLFMNNDIEVVDGWLDELLRVALDKENCGAVGAKLVYPEGIGGLNAGKDNLIQHRGIGFRYDSFNGIDFIRPYNLGNGEQAWPDEGAERKISAVTAAVLLVSKEAYDAVEGFDEQYVYGYEDVDLCLKLLERGYNNYYNPLAMLFHHEFGSQKDEKNQTVVARRTNNIVHFQAKWQTKLNTWLNQDRLNGTHLFSDSGLCFAFAVTEAGENVSAGDYFTAMELATSLIKHGHRVKYLCRRGPTDWYDVGEDVDILISMLDAYDLNKMYHTKDDLFTIAWARNWFTRWVVNPSIQRYSLIFASSKTACGYMAESTGLKVELFPIATNADRFLSALNQPENPIERERFDCDYVFTGSYWNAPREIMDILDPGSLPYHFRIFGKNWENVPKLADYTGGFLKYEEMPLVYKYTQIVVDDANGATIEYGAVNSRVFDALAAGRLVLTNGSRGAEETFEGMLPVFRNAQEFKSQIIHYLENPDERKALTEKLQKFVLENHTYDIRANTLLGFVRNSLNAEIPADKKIAIMIPVPKWKEAESWGDYHFSVAMKKSFEKKGYHVTIRILPEWEKDFDGKYVIVLRGLSEYRPKKKHVNLMWNISHPDDIKPEEYNQYDAVFVSSLIWAEHLKPLLKVPVYPLLQCTDPDVFNGESYGNKEKKYELLFVGNSRKIFRQIIKDVLPTPYDLAVYGTNWDGLIDAKYIRGVLIPNNQLGQTYHDADILLNDHWEDMRQKGFISNRIFDGLSAGAFIISDEIAGIDDVLKDCIVTYHGRDDLAEKVKYFMEHPKEREKIANYGMTLVREKHTFNARMEVMCQFMESQ